MSRFLSHGLIVFIFIASTLIPQKTLSNPSYDEASWRSMSRYISPILAARSSGIGGSQAHIRNAQNLALEPLVTSYSDENLRAKKGR